MKFIIMVAVHILIFGEMAGLKIVLFIATPVKMKKYFHGAMKKIVQPIRTRQFAWKQLILNYFELNWLWSMLKPFTTQYKDLVISRGRELLGHHGERKNVGNQHFLLFKQCFITRPLQGSKFELRFIFRLQMLSIWTCLKLWRLVKAG